MVQAADRGTEAWPAPALQPTPLIGRDAYLAALRQRIAQPEVRLLTLTGPAGIGKTRLAFALATALRGSFGGRVLVVPLDAVQDAALVPDTIAAALPGTLDPSLPPLERIKARIGHDPVLLALDNFEQVLAAATVVSDLLSACAGLKVLVTSRSPLHLRWEHEAPVPPLDVGDRGQGMGDRERRAGIGRSAEEPPAVALFAARARAVVPEFKLTPENGAAVTEICRRLDGVPLAIELAAARSRTLSPREILAGLERRLEFLTHGPRDLPVRQQTLREAIAWSYELLDSDARRLLRQLGVFVGGCTLEAAAAMAEPAAAGGAPIALDLLQRSRSDPQPAAGDECSTLPSWFLDALEALAHQSLFRREERAEAEPRLRMLETVREFALEQLSRSGEAENAARRHAAYFLRLAGEADVALTGVDQRRWLERLAVEHPNLRAALRWTIDNGDRETAARIAGALWRFWYTRGHITEGRDWLAAALVAPGRLPVTVRAKATWAAGVLARAQGDRAEARRLLQESLELFEELGESSTVATVLNSLGLLAQELGDPQQARTYFQQSLDLDVESGDLTRIAVSLNNLGYSAGLAGNWSDARRYFTDSLAMRRKVADQWGIANSLLNLGLVEQHEGNTAAAESLLVESLTLRHELGDRTGIARCLAEIAGTLAETRPAAWTARLIAAVQSLLAEAGGALAPDETERLAALDASMRERLGNQAYASARERGEASSLDEAIALVSRPATSAAPAYAPLTKREWEIAQLVARGLTDPQIADTLVIGRRTAESHVASILRKLDFTSRAQIGGWVVSTENAIHST